MEIKTDKLFVYGSLRRGFHHSAHNYISQYFCHLGDGMVKGVLYDLGEYPAAVPTSKQFFITGELYILKNRKDFEDAIGPLDDYEGLHPEKGEKPLFIRKVTKVFFNNCDTSAWIYWYNLPLNQQPMISSGAIFDYLTYKTKQ